MIKCPTIDAAHAIPGVVAIESGAGGIFAYVQGDAIPAYCQPAVITTPAPVDVDALQGQVASLQQALVTANIPVPAPPQNN
jgi:hypothetical protein